MDTFCSKCGRSLTADDNFCPQCGKPISSSALVINTPSNTPTIPALPFKNTLPMTSTDYGSNPYGVTASNPYYASPLKPPPPPRILRNNRPSIPVGVVLLVLILGNISTWVIFIHGTQSNANTAFATATSISNTNETLLLPRSVRVKEGLVEHTEWLAKPTTEAELVCAVWTSSHECVQRREHHRCCGSSRRFFAAP